MAIPKFVDLLQPILEKANQLKSEFKPLGMVDEIAKKFNLSHEEKIEQLSSGQSSLNNRISWAVTLLYKAKLVERTKPSYIKITKEGEKLMEKGLDSINQETLMQYPPFKEWIGSMKKTQTDDEIQTSLNIDKTPEANIEESVTESQHVIKQELLNNILDCSPEFFEKMVLILFKRMGYGYDAESLEHTGKTGDGGIDGIIYRDELGLDKIYIQAKRYANQNHVGSPEIQQFIGALASRGAKNGIFVTTSSFTKAAYETLGKENIVLIDGDKLAEYMLKHLVGCEKTHTYTIYNIDSDFFEDDLY